LRKAALIRKTYAGKRSISSPFFTLYALPKRLGSAARLPLTSFVVGKKVHPKAVRRNLVKRRLREAYKLLRLESLGLEQWYSMVLVGRDKINLAGWQEIKSSLREAIISLNLKYGNK
jgi:ribonuclease P protein component